MQRKGQGSLEYLLIIGGGILVAVVIIGAIVSLAGTGGEGNVLTIAEQACNSYQTLAQCESANVTSVDGATTTTLPCPSSYVNSTWVTGTATIECCWSGTPDTVAANKKCVLATNVVVS